MDSKTVNGIIALVGLVIIGIILVIGLHSCGAFEPSTFEGYKCSYCDKKAEYIDDGIRYCREHYVRYHG